MIKKFPYPTLMRFFEELSAIPRGSGHEEGVVAYLARFAKERNLYCYTDSLKNVLIRMPASAGYEHKEPILLQGHTDMVCEKNEGVKHDFLNDPLELYEENGWLRARGTTLGADDGVAVAAMLAILDGEAEAHPELECLFTSCEEAGMEGAVGFDYSLIRSRMMINLDGCDDQMILAGCAGGLRSSINLPVEEENCDAPSISIRLGGLAGGHSGEDIHRGRANAVKLMGKILMELLATHGDLRLVSFWGGDKDNAIPREVEARVCLSDPKGAREALSRMEGEIRGELMEDDLGFFMTVKDAEAPETVMDALSTQRVILLTATIANGVFAMHPHFSQLVSTSRNFGGMFADVTGAKAIFLSRSDSDAQIDRSMAELDLYASVFGGKSYYFYRFLGWEFSEQSKIRDRYREAYRSLFGKEIGVELIHAGLECGYIKHALPDMDIMCIGPRVINLHSPDEALELDSFARFFETLLLVLK